MTRTSSSRVGAHGAGARLAALLLLAVLGAQTAAPLAAASLEGARHGHGVAPAAAPHGGAHHPTPDDHHHPGCPWRAAGMPCPHAAMPEGLSLSACMPEGPIAVGAGSLPAILPPRPSLPPVPPAVPAAPAVMSVPPPTGGSALDPPPPRPISVP